MRLETILILLIAQYCIAKDSYDHNYFFNGDLIAKNESESNVTSNLLSSELKDSNNPLKLILLPDSYTTQRCLDGSPFGYYLREQHNGKNGHNVLFFLEGGGLCKTPKDCKNRKNGEHGSSKYWPDTFIPGKGGVKDILSDDPEINPYFYDFNHVYLKYCSGDTWTGSRTSFDENDLWFSGHKNLEAAIDHMNKTQHLGWASHALLVGSSAGGIGVLNNVDFFREKWLNQSTIFKAAPVGGFYFPGDVYLYPEWQHDIRLSVNSAFAKYLTTWYGSVLDESCISETDIDQGHMCWDAHYLYNHIDTSLFVSENRIDSNQLNQLLCPNPWENESTTDFMKWFGRTMVDGLISTVQSERGLAKGDGLFVPSCLEHTGNLCLTNGPSVNGKKLADLLPFWYFEEDPIIASTFQEIDSCNAEEGTELPCNNHCKC